MLFVITTQNSATQLLIVGSRTVGITGRIRKTKSPSLIDDRGTWGRAESSLRKRLGIGHPIPYRYGGGIVCDSSFT
ncbi:hypothetical protein JTE90_017512 [Oedothorax gibbosus]|uniref:Uncharacterized protein n=1 Tax=Oedothorax gibbosus TaxID=931172 RepID=A0AAV6UBG2_9ARAC|nr:hypothetical protein JTE90_017512 [Oedothorax gibbosus]